MKKVPLPLTKFGIILASFLLTSCEDTQPSKQSPTAPINNMSEDGISLNSKYRFAGEGDLFAVIDRDNIEVVPPGAAFTVIKKAYCIGHFGAGGHFFRDRKKIIIPKVFFVIYPNQEIEFYEPNRTDDRFHGDKITSDVFFN